MHSQGRKIWSVARSVVLALIMGTAALALVGATGLELTANDLLFRTRGPLGDDSPIVIVAIDDASFTESGLRWPWPRDTIAQIVEGVAAGNPKAIAIDVFFYEASRPAPDGALAQAIAEAGNVVLVNSITFQSQHGAVLRQLNRPLPELEAAAAAIGLANFPRDPDGVVRNLIAYQEHNEKVYFSWALQAARLYLGEDEPIGVSDRDVLIGGRRIDLQGQQLIVNYRGPVGSYPQYSAYQVIDGRIDPQVFADKIVIIGVTSESLHDSYSTPYGSNPPMPGAEINANGIDTILSGRTIHPVGGVMYLVFTFLAAFMGMVIAVRLRPVGGLIMVAAFVFAYGLLGVTLFVRSRILLPIASPLLGMGFTYVVGTSIRLYEEQRERARVHSLFERYVSPAAIKQMLEQPDSYALGGQRREVTVLFSDIRGFTSLSEQLTPDEVVAILNDYLSAMIEIVFKYEGTVDKFEGDAILAIFNAPLDVVEHPTKAILCAKEMLERLSTLQAQWAAQGRQPLQIGIGINTGPAFVGNIGSVRRMDYTVIGDTVNLASRLQDLTKDHDEPILFSEATCQRLRADIQTRFVAAAKVKGRVQQVQVYTVEGPGVEQASSINHHN